MAYPIIAYGEDEMNEVQLPFPHKVEVDIILPFDITTLDDGTIDVLDNGQQYDKRICQASFFLTVDQQKDLNTLIYSTKRAKGLILYPGGDGFHAFGPDKGDEEHFYITAVESGTPAISEYPFRMFECNLIMTNTGVYPAYSLPSEVDDGSFRIGNITGLHYPQQGFKPDQLYTISISHSENSTPFFFDRGSLGDSATTTIKIQCNESKAAALLYYLTNTVRANPFGLFGRDYYYCFGANNDDDVNYWVRLSNNTIRISQKQYDNWEITISVFMIY